MIQRGMFAFCLIVSLGLNLMECSIDNISTNIEIVQDVNEYIYEKPGVQLLQLTEETNENGEPSYAQRQYKLGNRISGDRLVANYVGGQSWPTPQNLTQTITYPKSGIGAVITLFQALIDQSSNYGRAYVTSGGVGQRQITVVIEANQTVYYQYNIEIYGY